MSRSTMTRRIFASIAAALGTQAAVASSSSAQSTRLPLVRGLTLVSVVRVPEGDRENTVVVQDVTSAGVTYGWRYRERQGTNAPVEETSFDRFVSAADLASAPRLNSAFGPVGARDETAGSTAMSISRAVFNRVRAEGKATYTTMSVPPGGSSLNATSLVAYAGTLTLVAPDPESMPMLVNGRRISLPALRMRGRFSYETKTSDVDYWVLADSAHPLILKIASGPKLFELIRIDLPMQPAAIEQDMTRECRVELPGIYFGFASAELQPASEAARSAVAAAVAHHADWSISIEGHTDSIGDPSSNQRLSLQRAEAVRSALIERERSAAGRLRAVGLGPTRPRETNATLEGRARNRRVELVRSCGTR